MPVYYALVEHGDFEKVLICNAAHVKNVPGRKTDYADAEWLAHLLECGLLAGSFVPPAEIKAARDVVRYRTKIVQQRVSEIARLGSTLQDAGIKTGLGGLVHRPARATPTCRPCWPRAPGQRSATTATSNPCSAGT
jgi:transposase